MLWSQLQLSRPYGHHPPWKGQLWQRTQLRYLLRSIVGTESGCSLPHADNDCTFLCSQQMTHSVHKHYYLIHTTHHLLKDWICHNPLSLRLNNHHIPINRFHWRFSNSFLKETACEVAVIFLLSCSALPYCSCCDTPFIIKIQGCTAARTVLDITHIHLICILSSMNSFWLTLKSRLPFSLSEMMISWSFMAKCQILWHR